MSDIRSWAISAAGNNAASPNGFPEGMAPSGVNDSAREVMAAVRRQCEDAQWFDFGDVPTQTSATTFTLAGDLTARYAVGRRLKLTDASTLYGTIGASSYGSPSTTVTVSLDSGSLSASLSAVAPGILTSGNSSMPTVPVSNGGTGATTAADARGNLGAQADVIATRGDLIAGDATPAASRLAVGGAGTHLVSDGVDPSWGMFLRSYLAGLTLSNNSGAPNTKIDIAAGVAADSTNARLMLSSGTLVIDCSTTGANGLDSGALANNTWYHAFLIMKADGTVAGLASTSAASPSMPSGYVYKRRIGSVLTDGSGNIVSFKQTGDSFWWLTAVQDLSQSAGPPDALAHLFSVTVPAGVAVVAVLDIGLGGVKNISYLFTSPDQADQEPGEAPSLCTIYIRGSSGVYQGGSGCRAHVATDLNAQIRYRASTTSSTVSLGVWTHGWIDRRGRDG